MTITADEKTELLASLEALQSKTQDAIDCLNDPNTPEVNVAYFAGLILAVGQQASTTTITCALKASD